MSYDVTIIDASLAGSAAANILSQAGLKVALIDKSHSPRAKPCGEELSKFGVDTLSQLGLCRNFPHAVYDHYCISTKK